MQRVESKQGASFVPLLYLRNRLHCCVPTQHITAQNGTIQPTPPPPPMTQDEQQGCLPRSRKSAKPIHTTRFGEMK